MQGSLAIAAAKVAGKLAQTFRLGSGTSLPGKVALKLDPGILKSLTDQLKGKRLAVTGTNGKTTTCGLLACLLAHADRQVVHNQLGANMLAGVTAAVVQQSNWQARLQGDDAVLEVDEASLRSISTHVGLDRLLVTNLFRDQLDRYGELDTTAKMIQQGFPKIRERIYLNADDPLVASLVSQKDPLYSKVTFFGMDSVVFSAGEDRLQTCEVPFPREVTACPCCGEELCYDKSFFGHLGHYFCNACHYRRPGTSFSAEVLSVTPAGTHLVLRFDRHLKPRPVEPGNLPLTGLKPFELSVFLPVPGLFNVVNFLAAATVFLDLGYSPFLIEPALATYQSVFGRAERRILHGRSVMILLIKNPVGASEVLKMVANDANGRLLICINDNYADGRDVSWLWDAMFEVIPNDRPIWVSGVRAEDMAVRLRYAGISEAFIHVEPDISEALTASLQNLPVEGQLYILPTYTALLHLKDKVFQ